MTRLVACLALLVAPLAAAQSGGSVPNDPTPYSDVRLLSEAVSGTAFDVALELTLDAGWHTYWTNPGDTGQPVAVDWTVPAGVTVGPLGFPPPERLEVEGIVSYAYYDTVAFPARVSLSAAAPDTVEIRGQARWLVCADVCLPVEAEVRAEVRRGELVPSGEAPAVRAARGALPAQPVGWTVQARATTDPSDERVWLTVLPPGDAALPDAAEFFPLVPTDVRPVGGFVQDDGGWIAEIPASPPPARLRGLIVAPDTLAGGVRAVEIDVVVEGAPVARDDRPTSLWTALVFAFLGGLILNLMPCVFPILSIKVLGFVGGDRDAHSLRRHGAAFAAGVLVSFWVLAGALLAFRAAGAGLGWGFQLQSPPVVAALAALMVALGLNLLGVFEVGGRLAGAAAGLDRRTGLGGAFGSGVLAVVVATPCTAPFMATALAYALAQPAVVALAVFSALGVGMALPYVLLSVFPAWTERLPRPGRWMETLRGALAFPLFATAVWLVWVFARQTGPDGAALLLLALVTLGLAAWIAGRATRRTGRVLALVALVAAFAAAGVAVGQRAPTALAEPTDLWSSYDVEALAAWRAEGRPVFVDVTAAWCLTCQVNERTALATDAVLDAFAAADVALVKADWTSQDAEITAFLDRFGRAGVPLYVYFPAEGEPVVLPEVLTAGIVLDALGAPLATR